MHPAESPLAAEGTPTSAITATTAAASSPALRDAPAAPATAGGAQEVCSYVLAPPAAAEAQPTAAAAAAAELAPGGAAASAPAQPFGSHPSADGHLVWTNDDGDIDALPWDMGGWSTGSSSERAEAAAAAAGGAENAGAEGQKEQQAVDEDALIGALRRKVGVDVLLLLVAGSCRGYVGLCWRLLRQGLVYGWCAACSCKWPVCRLLHTT